MRQPDAPSSGILDRFGYFPDKRAKENKDKSDLTEQTRGGNPDGARRKAEERREVYGRAGRQLSGLRICHRSVSRFITLSGLRSPQSKDPGAWPRGLLCFVSGANQ